MFTHGIEGFQYDPEDVASATFYLATLAGSVSLRRKMGALGKKQFDHTFDLGIMVERYRRLIFDVAPPTVLLDMDGVLVDWDKGFRAAWGSRSRIDRKASYQMEACVPSPFFQDARKIFLAPGFFEALEPMTGALRAIKEMQLAGIRLVICTSPVAGSLFCAQEKLNWVRQYLGADWLERVVITFDKTTIRGDLLIDDRPFDMLDEGGPHTSACWKQVIFHQPYNESNLSSLPRLHDWTDWRRVIMPLLGGSIEPDAGAMDAGHEEGKASSETPLTHSPIAKPTKSNIRLAPLLLDE